MTSLIDVVVQGVLLGGLYALFAAGLSLVFGIMRLVNLAHGDLIVLAAFLILALVTKLGLNPFVAALVAAPIMFALGWVLQSQVLNRTLGPDILPPLLVTFGLSIVIQNGLLESFSADSRRISTGSLETASLTLGSVDIGVMPLLTFLSAVAVIVGLNQLFYRTALGRAFRATSDDRVTAGLMGIRPDRIFATATGIAMVVVTIAALYLGARANFDPTIGPARLIYAFEAVIIGGLGSLTFGGVGLLTASRAQKIESISGLINLVMMPMWIFSGVFFSYERFPAVIHPFIKALPLTALNDALRASILEGTPLLQQWPRLLILALWGGISFVLALKWFRWT